MISYLASKYWPYHVSSGGVVFDGNQVLLLVRDDGGRATYHLPKGTLESGETLEETAEREILEESGAEVQLVGYLGSLNAKFESGGIKLNKVTHYFAAKLKSTKLRDMDSEHDGREWVSVDEAHELLKLNNNPKQEWVIIERLQQWLIAEENE